eukprot:gene16346-33326_t
MSGLKKRKADVVPREEKRFAASHKTLTLDDKKRPTRFVSRRGLDGEQQEWMVDATFTPPVKSMLIIQLIEALGYGKGASIMVPGAGISVIARDLCLAGYTNVHASDIDDGAVAKQQEYGVKEVSVMDLQACDADKATFGTFDVVIDSGVADVFFVGGGIKKCMATLNSLVADGGAMIFLSMHCRQWMKYIRHAYLTTHFSAIMQYTGNKRAKKHLRRDALLGVLVKPSATPATKQATQIRTLTSQDLPTIDLMLDQQNGSKWVTNPRSLGESDFNWESILLAAGACPGRG